MRTILSSPWLLAVIGGALLCSCSSTTTSGRTSCDPGSRKDCEAADGCQGQRLCAADGTWGDCTCGGGDGGSGNGGSGVGGSGVGGSGVGGDGGSANASTGGDGGASGSGTGGYGGFCAPTCNADGTALVVCPEPNETAEEPCVNQDADNCAVACDDAGGTARCVHTALDNDDDGYTAAACAPAPGPDCDDTTQLVSPGSTEVCDGGRDNDCDGYPDVLDASIDLYPREAARLRLANAVLLPLTEVDIAWHVDKFVVVASEPDAAAIYSGYALTTEGANSIALYNTPTFDDTPSGGSVYDSARVTSLNGTLGVLYRSDGRDYSHANLALLNDDGTVSASSRGFGGDVGDVTTDGSSFVLVSHNDSSASHPLYDFVYGLGNPAGVPSSELAKENLAVAVDYENAAYSNGVTAVVFTDHSGTQPTLQLMRVQDGSIFGPTELAANAQLGDIATLATGQFAVAWATPAGFKLEVRQANATGIVCEAAETSFGNGVLDELDSVAVAESSQGILVFAADAGGETGQGSLFVFDRDCNLISEAGKEVFRNYVATFDRQQPYLPRIAVGGGYVALAWSSRQSDAPSDLRTWVRVLPEAMCEP